MWSALTRIALAEFRKGFVRKIGTPAARDFLWLTVFFVLSSFLVFLVWSARQGIWERFEQVLLGALPGSGPPVRVSYHIDRVYTLIDAQLIDSFSRSFPALATVPMRDFDGQSGTIVLPGLTLDDEAPAPAQGAAPVGGARRDGIAVNEALSWGRSKEGSELAFRSVAMPLDSPIWQWVLERSGQDRERLREPLPLVIAASRTLFAKHFHYASYRNALVNNHRVPCLLRSELPEQMPDPTRLESLILQVKEGFARDAFHSFRIIWVDSFPMPEQVAFILPLPTVEALAAAEDRPNLELQLEGRGQPSRRVRKLMLLDSDIDSAGTSQFRQMAACLGAFDASTPGVTQACGVRVQQSSEPRIVPVLQDGGFEIVVNTDPQWPLRAGHVAQCAAKASLGRILEPDGGVLGRRLKVEWTDPTSAVQWRGPSLVEVPCRALIKEDRGHASGPHGNSSCAADKDADSDRGTAWLRGYHDAMVYVPPPATNLDDIVRDILGWRPDGRPVFLLDPAYESALIRFGVLSTLIDKISLPLAAGLGLLYLALSYVILATAFLHRRAQYGLLAMNGLMPIHIQYIVCVQIALAYLVGCIVGFAFFEVAIWVVNDLLTTSDIMRKAAAIIGLDVPTFLGNPSPAAIAWIWVVGTLVSVGLGAIILRWQGIAGAKAPIDLIKS